MEVQWVIVGLILFTNLMLTYSLIADWWRERKRVQRLMQAVEMEYKLMKLASKPK